MLLVSLCLVAEPKQLRILVWVVTLSVAFFGIKGGIYTIATAGGGRVWGPPGGLLQGNNELAVALTMLVPYMYWMRETASNRWVRRALFVAMVLCMVSIFGSQSRGALLAVVAMSFFLGIKSKHPVRMTALLAVGILIAIGFMSENWVDRMETIRTYQTDGSAMSRIWTWTTLWNAAVDNPITGAGFRADSRIVFDTYAPKGGEWFIFEGRVYVAHSIYFQMLGEHGFIGLFLFLALWLSVWLVAGRIGKTATGVIELRDWLPLLMRMTQASLVGYAVGGAFLSLAYLDLPYYFMGYVILSGIFVSRAMGKDQRAASPSSPVATDNVPSGHKTAPSLTRG
jgi:probable O-glycosylation ligase (exosortase A-associated)